MSVLEQALLCMTAFGSSLQEYFHHILSVLWKLLSPHRLRRMKVQAQADILICLKKLLPQLHVPEFGSELLLPLIWLVQSTGQSEKLIGEVMELACTIAMSIGPDGMAFFDNIKEVG